MGSVTRRFRRNIYARNMADKAGITMRPRRYLDSEGNLVRTFFLYVAPIHYRGTMLRVLRSRRQRDRKLHDHRQKTEAIQEKRTRKVRSEGSMLKRAFNKIFRPRGNR